MDISELAIVALVLALATFFAYDEGKKRARFYFVPRRGYLTPDLRQMLVTAEFRVKGTSTAEAAGKLREALNPNSSLSSWIVTTHGNMITLAYPLVTDSLRKPDEYQKAYFRNLVGKRSGVPLGVDIVGTEHDSYMDFDIEIKPALYFKVTQLREMECTEQEIQDAQHEGIAFANKIRGVIGAAELEPPAPQGGRFPSSVQKNLTAFGMGRPAELLSEAEQKIVGGRSSDGVKNCRSALEQTLESLVERNGLGKTGSFRHNLDRLIAKKYLAKEMADAIYEFYYRLVSEDVHDKYSAGPKEGKYVLDVTEVTIGYLLERLG
jgi:hypothetical protein